MTRARLLPVLAALVAVSVAFGADKAKAEKALKEALGANNADGIQAACDELIEVGGKDAFLAVLAFAGKVEAQAYWQLVGAAAGFRDTAALDELGRWVVANQAGPKAPIARDVLFGLQNNQSPKVLGPLAHVLEKGKLDLQLMVVDQLALLRSTDSVDILIAAYKREEKSDEELRRRLENALQHLTGESFGDAANWEGWWKNQRPNGLPDRKPGKKEKGGKATVAKPRDGEFNGTIEKLSKERFVVLSGSYDEMEQILEKREIPYTLAKKTDFDQEPQKFLKNAWVVLVNCDDCYEGKPPGVPDSGGKRLSERTLALLKRWVEDEGGSLFTEDWGLIDVTGVLWPDKISSLNGGAIPPMTDEMTVKLTPSRGSTSHPLMRAVWQKPRAEPKGKGKDDDDQKTTEKVESPAQPLKHKWKVDNLSAAVKIVDPKVTTLLDSDELAKASNGSVHVAVTFRVGKWAPKAGSTPGGAKATTTSEFGALAKGGRVLHTISHFGHQSSEEDGEALHNLLINLLLEAATRHGGAVPKK